MLPLPRRAFGLATLTVDLSVASILAQITEGSDVTVSMTIDDNEPLTMTATGEYATAMVQGGQYR